MEYNYSKLCGRIVEVFGTQSKFAKAMLLSERSVSLKLNNKVRWKDTEINRASEILGLDVKEIHIYFFNAKV